ncbi:hypothetical protein Leryth_004896 [Lithospermum erythrorhizon]|nr:hypothetical protein Leryth_004896 [Lithospermum erythrorhizon]
MGFRFFFSNLKSINRPYIFKIISQSNIEKSAKFVNPHLQNYVQSPYFLSQKRCHVGHSHDDDRSGKEGERIFRLGLAADIGLAAGKALTGYLTGSTAIIADAVHSVSDVVLSGVALLSFKASVVPKDKEHPYGHGKFETLGALAISGVLLATAGGIAWHAFDVLVGIWSAAPELVSLSSSHEQMHSHSHGGHHHGIDLEHPILAINMTVISIAIKEGLFWTTKRAGERAGSGLMKANAWHHRADAISSVVALIGVGGAYLGVPVLDPLAGIVVSGMILKAGLESGYQSVLELVDAALPPQELAPFKHTILQGCNRLRGRRAGSYLYLDVNIEVDPFSSVSAAHNVGENVRCQLQKNHRQITEVFIHIVPSTSDVADSIIMDDEGPEEMKNLCQDAVFSGNTDIKDIVSNILASKFAEKMVVERVTQHLLQGKTLLQIEVSMPPEINGSVCLHQRCCKDGRRGREANYGRSPKYSMCLHSATTRALSTA